MDELTQAIVHSVKDGDVLFIDTETIDIANLYDTLKMMFRDEPVRIGLCPVYVPKGKTVSDCIAVGRKDSGEKECQAQAQGID